MAPSSPQLIATTSDLFVREAREELMAAWAAIGGKGRLAIDEAAPGLLTITTPATRNDPPIPRIRLLEQLAAVPPIFVRHLHPVDADLLTDGLSPEDLETQLLAHAQDLICPEGVASADLKIAVQVRRLEARAAMTGGAIARSLQTWLGPAACRVEEATHILAVTMVGSYLYMGLGTPAAQLSPHMGGARHYDHRLFPISRAGAKLAEAMDLWGIHPSASGARAMDLGAAPGGWTAVLLDRGYSVEAIDPGEMDVRLRGHPRLVAHRLKAQDFRPSRGDYDLLTCDVNWDAPLVMTTVLSLAPWLRSGGTAVVTLKLQKGPAFGPIKRATALLAGAFDIVAAKLLFHNRREVTLLLRKR